jgi:glycosyltransferase involved in cell wall biosynthesis
MSPYASAVAAAALAERLDVPWVADLRDPWALDEMRVYPTRLHRRAEVARMRRSLGSAAAIVMNTGTAAEALVRTMPELSGRVDVIPNGFDAADFDGDPPARADDAFRIVHAGYLHTEDGLRHRRWSRRLLGGSVRGVDLLTRSAWYLVEALDGLCSRDPELARTVELHLAGVLSDADRVSVDRPYARLHGYLEHAKTLDLVRSADLLFLPMQNLRAGERATIVPGKTYEYLASGRPILAAVPDGDARDLLVRSGVARVCRPDDVAALADGVAAAVERWRRGERPRTAPAELLARFERRRLAEKAAAILDGLGYASGSVPRLAPAPA